MTNIYEVVFYGIVGSTICAVNLVLYYKKTNKFNESPKLLQNKLISTTSLQSFEQFLKIESGETTLKKVYSNEICPHCGVILNLKSIYPRYFAFDNNICEKCYNKMMINTRK